MTDPSDADLYEFVARFSGWRNFDHGPGKELWGNRATEGLSQVPDYLHDLNAWHNDVWPELSVKSRCWPCRWEDKLLEMFTYRISALNATARERCLALWRALDGVLPEVTT